MPTVYETKWFRRHWSWKRTGVKNTKSGEYGFMEPDWEKIDKVMTDLTDSLNNEGGNQDHDTSDVVGVLHNRADEQHRQFSKHVGSGVRLWCRIHGRRDPHMPKGNGNFRGGECRPEKGQG